MNRHTFTNDEKLAYINAELCFMKKPPLLNSLPHAASRFEEFQALHQVQSYRTHFVGSFLPFHRAMLHAHEEALRSECGYKGWQPYWQEERDAGKFTSSIVFDKVYGFGGDGSGQKRCITDGPFAGFVNHIGPGNDYTDHCIDRQISNFISRNTSDSAVENCLKQKDYVSAWTCLEAGPHFGGHGGVGRLVRGIELLVIFSC